MRYISLFFLLAVNITTPKMSNPSIQAFSYVVMEKESHRIIDSRNEFQARTVASISKLMTAYMALKYGNLDDVYVVGDEINVAYGSCVYLNIGEQITLRELLYALMLRSGNDASLVIAKNIFPGEDFVEKMNSEVASLRLPNALFRNPHGLDEVDGGNECSAYSIAILQSYLLDFAEYRTISTTQKYNSSNHGVWFNKNRLLKSYQYTTGGKTGFTVKAKRTLVTSAKKDDLELIIVTINCGNDFALHKSLYQQYFDIYEGRIIFPQGEQRIDKYIFEVPAPLHYFLLKTDWQRSSLLYRIDETNLRIKVTLILDDENIPLAEYKISKIGEKETKLTFWQKIVRWFKKVFSTALIGNSYE